MPLRAVGRTPPLWDLNNPAGLEDRGLLTRILCADDRRGIYTELTASGVALLEEARPVRDATLERTLDEARGIPELAALVHALPGLHATV